MFKKTLIAISVTGALFAGVQTVDAADITGTTKTFSIEGSASLDTVNANAVVVTLGAEYSNDDIITFTFAGADYDSSVAAANAPVVAGLTGAGASMTLGLLSATATTLTYRVTDLLNATSTIGATITLPVATLAFDRDDAVANDVTATYQAKTDLGLVFDLAGAKESLTETILTAEYQFDVDRSKDDDFDAVINVEADRKAFAPVADDAADVTTVDAAGTLAYAATGGVFNITLNGDFAFLDTDAKTAGIQTTAVNPAPDTIDATSMTFDGNKVGTLTVTIDADAAGNVIPTQMFTADVDVDYTDFGDKEAGGGTTAAGNDSHASGTDVGEWTLNGSVVNVPYMPMGPNTQPIIRHTNIGTQTGDVTLRYMVEGEHTVWQDGGTVLSGAAPGVHNMLSETEAALLADGFDRSAAGFKVTLEYTTNVPANDVTVFAAAKVSAEGQDRLTVGAFSN